MADIVVGGHGRGMPFKETEAGRRIERLERLVQLLLEDTVERFNEKAALLAKRRREFESLGVPTEPNR
jgi:hypothetical protein